MAKQSSPKPFNELTKFEIKKLKDSGLLYTIYPESEDAAKSIPQPKKDIDWSKLTEMAKQNLIDISKDEERSDDDHYIYEEVMKTIYGKDIFDWINSFDR